MLDDERSIPDSQSLVLHERDQPAVRNTASEAGNSVRSVFTCFQIPGSIGVVLLVLLPPISLAMIKTALNGSSSTAFNELAQWSDLLLIVTYVVSLIGLGTMMRCDENKTRTGSDPKDKKYSSISIAFLFILGCGDSLFNLTRTVDQLLLTFSANSACFGYIWISTIENLLKSLYQLCLLIFIINQVIEQVKPSSRLCKSFLLALACSSFCQWLLLLFQEIDQNERNNDTCILNGSSNLYWFEKIEPFLYPLGLEFRVATVIHLLVLSHVNFFKYVKKLCCSNDVPGQSPSIIYCPTNEVKYGNCCKNYCKKFCKFLFIIVVPALGISIVSASMVFIFFQESNISDDDHGITLMSNINNEMITFYSEIGEVVLVSIILLLSLYSIVISCKNQCCTKTDETGKHHSILFFTRSNTHRFLRSLFSLLPSFTTGKLMDNLGNPGSLMDQDLKSQRAPYPPLQQITDTPSVKRNRSYLSPPNYQLYDNQYGQQPIRPLMTHPVEKKKINFPPIIVSFKAPQQASISELSDDLTTKWKAQHGIDIYINARFGHLHSFLVFTDDSSTFESLLDPLRWPIELKGVEMSVKVPRQLPPEYSLIIQQFHRNWIEDEMLNELKQNYVSITKLTRMKIKDGSPLNAVRADFKSKDEVTSILRLGKIKIGSMIHPVKPYYLPIRINKCMKCLQHDHETKSCTRLRLCPRCAEEHSLENGCPNNEKCVNCGGGHVSGHSACPIVQERRRSLVEQAQKKKSELLVAAEQRLHQQMNNNRNNIVNLNKDAQKLQYNQIVGQQQQQQNSSMMQNVELLLTTHLKKIDDRIEEFSSRFSSHVCELEKKLDMYINLQRKQEKVVNELILPTIQALHRSINVISKKDDKSNDLAKLMKEINYQVGEYYRILDSNSQVESSNQLLSQSNAH